MSEAYTKLPDDSANTGSKVRTVSNTVSAQTVVQQVLTIAKSDATLLDGPGVDKAMPQAHAQPAATTGGLGNNTDFVTVTVTQYAGAFVSVKGTHTGVNFSFLASDDSGTTYYAVEGVRLADGTAETTSGVLGANATRVWWVPFAGATTFKVLATAWSSGTATIRITPTTAVLSLPFAGGPVASGATDAGAWLGQQLTRRAGLRSPSGSRPRAETRTNPRT